MNMPTGQYCPPSIGMVAAFKLESLAGIVGIRNSGTVAASDLSVKDKFEEVAKEWSALAVWAELKRSSPSTATEVDPRDANRIWAS